MFGDGVEERLDAFALEMRLRRCPIITQRRNEYFDCVNRARVYASHIGKEAVISELVEHNPSYIRNLLETEDARFGDGSLFERYARTFWKDHK